MSEREFYIDCEELEKLVELLHPDTKIVDLEPIEKVRVFSLPVSRKGLEEPGALFRALSCFQPNFPIEKYKKWKIRSIHRRYCCGDEK